MNNVFLVIDLKTFFASVECVERDLDPFTTNLVVADPARGKGAICLAISPKMKMLGVKNRCRIFEIPKNIEYITALPRMNKYIEYSANIYEIYLKYISKEDIHIYSIDEAFIDVTNYLKTYNMKSIELAKKIMKDIYDNYGITATCGIGTNMYLAKIALDIMSKHSPTNIGWLNEERYIKELWHHKPLTDFWQIGKGIQKRLNKLGLYDMADIAKANPKILFKEFGINAQFLIDHSKGIEPCTIKDIKEYTPKNNSISNSQILFKDYTYEKAKLVLKEMVEVLAKELIEKDLVTDLISLYIGYSNNIINATGGSRKLYIQTNQYSKLVESFINLFEETTNKEIMIRRIGISFGRLEKKEYEQMNLFINEKEKKKELKIEKSIINIKEKYGKNAILKGMNLQEDATTIIRNKLIGGHNGY
ncbi:MAG: DNA repair protein [Clostridiales bacterium]|nr:DNA repair protein [Clostridiales bacterium]